MSRLSIAVLLTATALSPFAAHASTVTTTFNYSANNVGLDDGTATTFNRFTTVDVGIANLRFGAAGSTGDVDATGRVTLNSTFERNVSFADSRSVAVKMVAESLRYEFDTFMGAEAGAFVNFKAFNTPFGDVNPPEIAVIGGDDYSIRTDGAGTRFNTTTRERGTAEIAGVGPDGGFGAFLTARVSLNASQSNAMRVNGVDANLVAVHESGARVSSFLSFSDDIMKDLDLSLAGEWTLGLENTRLRNSFNSSSGISAGYNLGIGVGLICGDLSDDDDNTLCLDSGTSGDTDQLTLINPPAFEIDWGSFDRMLGTITVAAAPVVVAPVPLPAGLPLMALGLGALGLARARSKRD